MQAEVRGVLPEPAVHPRAVDRDNSAQPPSSRVPGGARQLGWIPPTPAYLFKMARSKRRAERP